MKAFVFKTGWYDIGGRKSYINANIDFMKGKNMLETDNIHHSRIKRSYVGKNTLITNSAIKNCVIFDNVHIENCALKNCVIDSDSRLS